MTPLVLMAIMVGAPILLMLLLRINAALVFLSLCLGSVLVQFAGKDAQQLVNLFSASKTVSVSMVALGLLLVPVLFTMIVMIRTVRGGKLLLNLLPAAAVGVVGLLLAEPHFSPGLQGSISHTTVWHELQRAQALIVGVSTLVSLLFLWLQRPKRHHADKPHH